jgi:5-formyltetrahydrofolate cyclo-ligase
VRALVSAPGSHSGKPALRRGSRDTRDSIPAATRRAAAEAIADALDREVLAGLPDGAVVALYAAVASEVDTAPIAARALARGLRLAYPRVVRGARRLAFALAGPDELAPGRFRIPAPPETAPAIEPTEVAAFVVPGIAFDHRGARLGWGHGYYDTTLAAAPAALRVGVAFESQLVARVPTDPRDVPVHVIVTEAAVHRCA